MIFKNHGASYEVGGPNDSLQAPQLVSSGSCPSETSAQVPDPLYPTLAPYISFNFPLCKE